MDRNPYQYHPHGHPPPSLHGNMYPYPPYIVQPAMGGMLRQHQTVQHHQHVPQFHPHPVHQQPQLLSSHLHSCVQQSLHNSTVQHGATVIQNNRIHSCPSSTLVGSSDNDAPTSNPNSIQKKADEGLDKQAHAVQAIQKVSKPKYEMQWRDMFHRLKLYKETKGDTLVPQNYEEDPPLGKWVNTQRRQYKLHASGRHSLITPERIELLNEEGFVWDASAISRFTKDNLQWQEMYKTLLKYFEESGHCRVPRGYAKNRKLATWVNNQRSQHKRMMEGNASSMSEQKIQQLEKIGFDWARAKKLRTNTNASDELYYGNHHLHANARLVTAHQTNEPVPGGKEAAIGLINNDSTNLSLSQVASSEVIDRSTERTHISLLKHKDYAMKLVEPKPHSSKSAFISGLPTRERQNHDDRHMLQVDGNDSRYVSKEVCLDQSVGVHEDISFLASSLLEMKNQSL